MIVEFDGRAVNSFASFRNLVSASDAGKSYALKFFRGGKPQEVKITPAPEKDVKLALKAAPGLAGFGLEVEPITADTATSFGYPKDADRPDRQVRRRGRTRRQGGPGEGRPHHRRAEGQGRRARQEARPTSPTSPTARKDLVVYVKDVNHPEADSQMVTLQQKP